METLLDGVNHIALLTRDMDRFIRFYQEVFEAQVVHDNRHHAGHGGERMVIMALGGQSAFNVFEVPGNTQAQIQTPMFGRGRLDHFGLNARSRETFEQARRLCRKFAFLRPNPKIGCQKINDLRDSTFLFSVICDRAVMPPGGTTTHENGLALVCAPDTG